MISRRKLPAFLLAAALQPYYPTRPDDEPLTAAEFQLMASILLDVLLQAQFNHEKRIRRMEWLVPGVDLYENEEGDV